MNGRKIEFGTAGLRAIMGDGPSEMNLHVIRIVTQGIANYLKSFSKELASQGVVVCHDSRINSRAFAEATAQVFAGNQIKVYLTKDLRPTPFASFAIRHYKAAAGVNITASHNPKEYNGYKVYWSDGAQVVHPHDEKITEEVQKVSSIQSTTLDDPLIQIIPLEVEEAYLKAIANLSLSPKEDHVSGSNLHIIYSPLNGAGITMIPQALKLYGFTNVSLVEEQKNPDGTFPTTPYPNPETDAALALGMRDLVAKKGDILLVSDPDSDRLSASILYQGKPKRLTGNELGAIFLHYLLKKGTLAKNFASVTTIVSTPLIKAMTEKAGGTCFEVLTGFKYIGEKIHEWELSGEKSFLFGMEESLGFLYGTHARDKDATIAACLAAEIALGLKQENKTLMDALFAIYKQFGLYREAQKTLSSEKGLSFLTEKLDALRNSPRTHLADIPIVTIEDYLTSTGKDLATGKTWKLSLPPSNVLAFSLKDKSKFLLRPSGTEPKLKIYGHIFQESADFPSIEAGLAFLEKTLQSRLNAIASYF